MPLVGQTREMAVCCLLLFYCDSAAAEESILKVMLLFWQSMKALQATNLDAVVAQIPSELHLHWYTAERGVSPQPSALCPLPSALCPLPSALCLHPCASMIALSTFVTQNG